MLFNSYDFIFIFMPVVFTGFFLISRLSHASAIAWLGISSVFFYAYWSLYSLPIMMTSIIANYFLGIYLSDPSNKYRNISLLAGLIANLIALGFFKYANFFIENSNEIRNYIGLEPLIPMNIALPIGISFFTFTQIAFLVDCSQGKVRERSFSKYILFVSFFPHLLAGPILHHKQMMSQFSDAKIFSIDHEKIKLGIIFFTMGLGKKILLADPLGGYADILFNGLVPGTTPRLVISWLGSLAYTFQIYFDFSGYSDMAVGLALFFGIWIPFNFNAPLRAKSMIDFWQRWHMSLTKYINDYLYTPITLRLMRIGMGRGRLAEVIYSLIIPTISIMLIIGLWHGSSWTFVAFGAMHGIFLVINHLWRRRPKFLKMKTKKLMLLSSFMSWLLTFLCVVMAMVMFRSSTVSNAMEVYKGMLGMGGLKNISEIGFFRNFTPINFESIKLVVTSIIPEVPTSFTGFIPLLCLAFSIALYPFDRSVLIDKNKFQLSKFNTSFYYLFMMAAIFTFSILLMAKNSPFLYFQF